MIEQVSEAVEDALKKTLSNLRKEVGANEETFENLAIVIKPVYTRNQETNEIIKKEIKYLVVFGDDLIREIELNEVLSTVKLF